MYPHANSVTFFLVAWIDNHTTQYKILLGSFSYNTPALGRAAKKELSNLRRISLKKSCPAAAGAL